MFRGFSSLVLALVVMSVGSSFAAPAFPDCNKQVMKLSELQKAQSQLLNSLTQKNLTIAESLESFASRRVDSQPVVPFGDSTERSGLKEDLHFAATKFKEHHKREALLVQKFERLSGQLIKEIQLCWAQRNQKSETLSSLSQDKN